MLEIELNQNIIQVFFFVYYAHAIKTNRPYLESAIFETCMISIFILVSFERNNKSEKS